MASAASGMDAVSVPPYDGAAPALARIGLWGAEDPLATDDDAFRWFVAAVGRKP